MNQFHYNQVDPKRDPAREAASLYRRVALWGFVIMSQVEGKQEEMT